MTAGLVTLKKLKDHPEIYLQLEEKAKLLEEGLKEQTKSLGIGASFNRVGSMMCMFFTETEVVDLKSAMTSDTKRFSKYFEEMLKQGIYLAPSQFEAAFISVAHTREDIDKTLEASQKALKKLL